MDKCNRTNNQSKKDIRGTIFVTITFLMFTLTTSLSLYTHYKMNSSIESLNVYMEKQLENDKRLLSDTAALTQSLAEQNIRISKNTEAIMDMQGFPIPNRPPLADIRNDHIRDR